MKNSDFYPLKPSNVDKDTWFYVVRRGILAVRQVKRVDGVLVKCDMFYLPWSKVCSAVDKYRKVKRRSRRR